MDSFNVYAYGTAGWLALQAVPRLFTPRLILAMLSEASSPPTSTEDYLCRCNAFALLTLSLLTLVLTGSIPLTASYNEGKSSSLFNILGVAYDFLDSAPTSAKNPYITPTLMITTAFHAASTFYAYAMYMRGIQFFFAVDIAASGALAALGLWCNLFQESGHISKRTGADKRTSGFPFSNKEADKKKGR
jgi:hypothetical protein